MNDVLKNSRVTLVSWGDEVRAAGVAAPEPMRLADIAADGLGEWSIQDHVESGWAPTIDHLLRQVRLGVQPDAARALLPERLKTAAGSRVAPPEPTVIAEAAAAAPAPAPVPEPVVDPKQAMTEALIAWRSEQVAAGVPGADALRDITLRNLVKFDRTTADEIRSALIGPAAELADELAAVMARVAGTDTSASSPASSPAPAPSAPPPSAPAPATPVTAPSAAADEPPARHRRTDDREQREPVSTPTPPAPTPMASPRAATPAASRPTAAPLTLTHADFCEFGFVDGTDQPQNALTVEQTTSQISISWDAMPVDAGQTVVYRVVSGEDAKPYKPEAGDLLAVDDSQGYSDGRFLTSAYRVYQVWAHVGAAPLAARANQPVLWAQGEAVSAVEDFELFEEDGRVIGRWSVRHGTRSVRVMRRSLDGGPGGAQQIAAGQDNLGGFVDPDVPRGRRFLYRAEAEVSVGETVRLAPAAQQEVLVSVSLNQVRDLVATATDGASFDLTWSTPEAGQQVDIYRFAAPPPAGLESEDRDASTIDVAGFTEAEKIKDPIRLLNATASQIVGVRWPGDWNRAYLTPVTSFNGRVRIGTTAILTRPIPAVIEPRIIERFHTQLITFGWPDGAAGVQIFVGMETVPSEQICQGNPYAEVTATKYRRDGAVVLPRPLDSQGCKVCVVPVAYSHGEQLSGAVSDISYRGLRRLKYELRPLQAAAPVPGAPQSRTVAVGVQSDINIPTPPVLVAVFNPERLPLDQQDGQPLHFQTAGDQARPFAELGPIQPTAVTTGTPYSLDLANRVGFVRLFVNETDHGAETGPSYALVDPPMYQLYLQPPQNPVHHG